MVSDFERLQREAAQRRAEMLALLERYRRKGGQLPTEAMSDLTEEQRQILLAERVEQERPELRGLVKDAVARDRQLQALKAELANLQPSLPDSVVAQPGDRHDRIVLDFLQRKSVPELEARRLIDQISLQEPLLPNFRVWLYLGDDSAGRSVFSTWVTQGSASMTPQEAQRRVREALESERAKVSDLEQRKASLEKEIGQLREEADELFQRMGELRRKADQADSAARYLAGSRRQLKEGGVIGTTLFGSPRLKKLENLHALDLDASSEITLDSSEYGLPEIKKVTLLPDSLKRDVDYRVALLENGAFAKVRLVNPRKFKRSTFVIVME